MYVRTRNTDQMTLDSTVMADASAGLVDTLANNGVRYVSCPITKEPITDTSETRLAGFLTIDRREKRERRVHQPWQKAPKHGSASTSSAALQPAAEGFSLSVLAYSRSNPCPPNVPKPPERLTHLPSYPKPSHLTSEAARGTETHGRGLPAA